MSHAIRIDDVAYEYLQRRARRTRRTASKEATVVLLDLMAADPEDESNAAQASVLPHEPQLIVPDVGLVRPVPEVSYRGVRRTQNGWVAEIRINDRRHWIGDYTTPEDAAHAYDRYVLQLPGNSQGVHETNFSPAEYQLPLDPPTNYPLNHSNPPTDRDPCPICGGWNCDCLVDGGEYPRPPTARPVLRALPSGIRIPPSDKPPRKWERLPDSPLQQVPTEDPTEEAEGDAND